MSVVEIVCENTLRTNIISNEVHQKSLMLNLHLDIFVLYQFPDLLKLNLQTLTVIYSAKNAK